MVPNYATNRGTRHRVVTRHVANHAANDSALYATMRTRDDRKCGQGQCRHQQIFPHVESPHATRKTEFIVFAKM
jgi:hypothetical protein